MTRLTSRGLTAAVLLGAFCICSTASLAEESGSPLSVLDRMFGTRPPARVPQTTGQDARGPTTDQVLRIERLEAQIRQMTGTIEQLQYRNQQLEAQIRGMGGGAAAPGGAQPRPSYQPGPPAPVAPAAVTERTSAVPGRRSDVFDPSQNPNAPGVPRALGTMQEEPPPVVTADTPVGVPGGRNAGGPLDLSSLATGGPGAEPSLPPIGGGALPPPPARNLSATGAVAAVAPPADSPKDYYDLGYGYVLRKDYALAEQTFQVFLQKFPNDRRAGDAQFWLGESLFQRQRYDAAAQAFLDLSTKQGSHAKAPDSLLRLAQSLAAMKQKEMACATLAEVGRKYPKASASVKQGVEREQKRVAC